MQHGHFGVVDQPVEPFHNYLHIELFGLQLPELHVRYAGLGEPDERHSGGRVGVSCDDRPAVLHFECFVWRGVVLI